MGEWVAWLAGAGLFASAVGFLLFRAERTRAGALESDQQALQARLDKLDSELARERKTRQKQAEDLSEFRKRADKAKRRSGKQGAQPLGTGARISDLEAELERASSERDRVIREKEALGASLEAARREAQVAAENAERVRAESRASAAAREETSTAEADPTDSLRAELAKAHERIKKLESEHTIAKQTESRIRKRMQNQEMLYASVRSELEVKKDRLRTQEEQIQRLEALKVVMEESV